MTRELQDIFMRELHRRRLESEASSSIEGESQMSEAQELPCYVHSTDTIYKFLFSITQPPARLYQEVLSLAAPGQLGPDHQRLACVLFTLLRATYSAVNLRKMELLWKSKPKSSKKETKRKKDNRKPTRGLGLSETLEKYGFGYPERRLINWRELAFVDAVTADTFPHPSMMISNLVARPQTRQRTMTLFQEIDHVVTRLRTEDDEEVKELLLDWLGMRLIRQYHDDVVSRVIDSKYVYKNHQAHLERRMHSSLDNETENGEQPEGQSGDREQSPGYREEEYVQRTRGQKRSRRQYDDCSDNEDDLHRRKMKRPTEQDRVRRETESDTEDEIRI